jgi:hypothetical protein
MAFHYLAKLLTPAIPVIGQITAGETHPDFYVVARDEEADITEAVIYAGRKIALELGLREHMVSVLSVCVADDTLP